MGSRGALTPGSTECGNPAASWAELTGGAPNATAKRAGTIQRSLGTTAPETGMPGTIHLIANYPAKVRVGELQSSEPENIVRISASGIDAPWWAQDTSEKHKGVRSGARWNSVYVLVWLTGTLTMFETKRASRSAFPMERQLARLWTHPTVILKIWRVKWKHALPDSGKIALRAHWKVKLHELLHHCSWDWRSAASLHRQF